MRRKGVQEGVHVPPEKLGASTEIVIWAAVISLCYGKPVLSQHNQNFKVAAEVTTDFGYEFCFEAPNGSVKWYKA